jgi:hypothetical protein
LKLAGLYTVWNRVDSTDVVITQNIMKFCIARQDFFSRNYEIMIGKWQEKQLELNQSKVGRDNYVSKYNIETIITVANEHKGIVCVRFVQDKYPLGTHLLMQAFGKMTMEGYFEIVYNPENKEGSLTPEETEMVKPPSGPMPWVYRVTSLGRKKFGGNY